MKKIFMSVMVMILVFSIQAFGSERPEFLDNTYCIEIEGTEFCLDFVQGPFGPGYRGELNYSYRNVDSPFSPIEWKGPFFLTNFAKIGNNPIELLDLNMEAQIKNNGLEIYQPKKEMLFLREQDQK